MADIMKNLLLGVIASVVISAFHSCSGSGSKGAEIQTSEAAARTVKITVVLPDGWEPVQGSVLEHQYMKNGASFMIKEEKDLNGESLSEAVVTGRQQIEKYFKGSKFAGNEALKVDGHDAVSLIFSYGVNAGNSVLNMKMKTVYVMVEGTCQTISFGSLEDSFDSLSADISKIIDGIKFGL
jgi:hypothetical protein